MLRELKVAKQVFYRFNHKFPNAIKMSEKTYKQLKLEWKEMLSTRHDTVFIPRINGMVINIDNNLKEPFEMYFDEEYEPTDD